MAWTSFAGSRLGSVILFLLFVATEVHAQKIVARQTVERMIASQFMDEWVNQSYFFTLYKNRLNDISSLDMVDIAQGSTWQYSIPDDHYWVGVHHYEKELGLVLVQYGANLDSLYFKELIYAPGQGWKESRLLGSLSYSSKNRRPKMRLLEKEEWVGVVSTQATYWSKEIVTLRWKKQEGQLTDQVDMNWKLPIGESTANLERWEIDGRGNFWLMSGNNRRPQPKMDLSQLVKAELIHLNVAKKHAQQWDLILGQRSLREVFFLHDQGDFLRCIATFSNSGKEQIDGAIVYDLSSREESVKQQHLIEIEQPEAGVPWIAQQVMVDSLGGFWIWGEEYFYKEVRSMDRMNGPPTGPVTVQYQEYFEDVYGWHVDAKLETDTLVVLPKKQVGMELDGASFSVSWRNGPLVRFNDHSGSRPELGEIKEWSGQRTVLRSYWQDGNIWKSEAKDMKDLNERGNGNVLRLPLDMANGRAGIFLSGNYFLICTE
jgi:hypothetical protein